MPQRIIALLHDLSRRLQMPSSIRTEPQERRIAATRVGDGEPFVHGLGGRLPVEGRADAEGVDDWDGLPGVRVGVEELAEARCVVGVCLAGDREVHVWDACRVMRQFGNVF